MISDRAALELNWFWIAIMATAPLAGAFLIAFPIWRLKQTILGNLAGAAVIFATAIALIMRESIELRQIAQACVDAQTTCWANPPEFTRDVIYASIGLLQVFVLFLTSLRVEQRIRRQNYSPEWR